MIGQRRDLVKFVYNKNTCKLHIQSFCPNSNYTSTHQNIVIFNSEDEALKYDGRAVSMCKVCQKKREKINKENNC